jgi:hypothetical protein
MTHANDNDDDRVYVPDDFLFRVVRWVLIYILVMFLGVVIWVAVKDGEWPALAATPPLLGLLIAAWRNK